MAISENCCFLADGIGPDQAQQVAASDQGRHYSLRPNLKVKLNSCFAENCRFPAMDVDPD